MDAFVTQSISLLQLSQRIFLTVENLLQNITSYFSRSPKRQQTLLEFQQFMKSQQLKILKPSTTRWLALCNCVERILLMWDVLCGTFRLANFEKESDVAALIFNDKYEQSGHNCYVPCEQQLLFELAINSGNFW
jgi:hypothetical protein